MSGEAQTSPQAARADTLTRADNLATFTTAHGCFLCAFSANGAGRVPQCEVAQIEGQIARVMERAAGDGAPLVTLAREDGAQVDILLTRDDRALAQSLATLPTEKLYALHLRIFHLFARAAGQRHADAAEVIGDTQPSEAFRLRTSPISVVIVEPDSPLNITDINNAEYCVRQYPLRRMAPSAPTAATLKGTIIHQAFMELLKSGRDDDADVSAYLAQAVHAQLADLALRQISAEQITAEAEPHMQALAQWYRSRRSALWSSSQRGRNGDGAETEKVSEHTRPEIRAETFLLAPEVGLRGRLDALMREEQGASLLELKTGQAYGDLPKSMHRWQVFGYQTLLTVRRPGDHKRPGATLLYSGTAGQAEGYGIPFSLRDLRRVIELRNKLAIVHATGIVPAPPGGAKCGRCAMRATCAQASALLGWQAPPDVANDPAAALSEPLAPADVAWFGRLYELLRLEARAAEEQAATLWRLTPAERCAAGSALGDLEPDGEPIQTANGEWEYHFRCRQTSELREGDAVVLSDGDPIHGEIVMGSILRMERDHVVVWTPERITHPRLLDRYESEIVHDRTVRNLWRWLEVEDRLRALVNGSRAPKFGDEGDATEDARAAQERGATAEAFVTKQAMLLNATDKASQHDEAVQKGNTSGDEPESRTAALLGGVSLAQENSATATMMPPPLPPSFNAEQRLAVGRALAARDYLLIQGPPGTGKTSVVAEIVRQAVARGERVLLAAFTNQAVDNALRRMVSVGVDDFVRLGHALSVAPDIQPYRLMERTRKRLAVTASEYTGDGDQCDQPNWTERTDQANGVLRSLDERAGVPVADAPRETTPITPADLRETLLRARVVAATAATWSAERYDDVGEPLRFDLAIVDEASQLTIPAVLGALRFARRFILVGDERQLPPLVMSAEAGERGLKRSLFGDLLEQWGDLASVALRRQYRMLPTICAFPSQAFYDGALYADETVSDRPLAFQYDPADPLALILDPQKPVIFVDTPASDAGGVSMNKVNKAQALAARRIVLAMRAGGVAAERIGVIAPFRAQVAEIRQQLAAYGETQIAVDTVDRFQGGEREVILFSFGGPAPTGATGARSYGADFLADPHRLNVALTRAQRKLILLGDRQRLAQIPLLASLINSCERLYGAGGGIVSARWK